MYAAQRSVEMSGSADAKRSLPDGARRPHRPKVFAQVGEWLKPTDCKSVPPSEVRRFESFPVHQRSNPERRWRKGSVNESQSSYRSVAGIPRVGCARCYDPERSANPGSDTGDSWIVRVQDLGAAKRRFAFGSGKRSVTVSRELQES